MHLEKPIPIKGVSSIPTLIGPSVRLAHRFAAPPERVFQAWLDPLTAGRWLFATATRPMTEVSITPRPGGTFRFADGRAVHVGRYIQIAAPRHLAFELDDGDARSRVCIEVVRRGAGCLLSLMHSDLSPGRAVHMKARWEGMLYGLGLLLDSTDSEVLALRNPPARLRRVGPL